MIDMIVMALYAQNAKGSCSARDTSPILAQVLLSWLRRLIFARGKHDCASTRFFRVQRTHARDLLGAGHFLPFSPANMYATSFLQTR